MAHELTISVGKPPNVFLVPTVIDGVDIGKDEALRMFERGELEPLEGPFKTIEEADRASEARSLASDKPFPQSLFPGMNP